VNAREEYIARLRKLADLLEETPGLIMPYDINKDEIRFFPSGAKETAATARLFPSSWSKNDPKKSTYDASYYKLTGAWEGVAVVVLEDRAAVCERVQVGTTVVEHEAAEAYTEERPVYEYECSPLLAKAGS
jgi:hypothetical protein